jgi:hypothetical protein
MAKTDWEFVRDILNDTESMSNTERAQVIADKLGKRIRGRGRDRAEDARLAAARAVSEATERL